MAKVIDSNGVTVGKFISLIDEGKALVQLTVDGKKYIQTVYPDKIGDEANMVLYYTEGDCGGQGYIEYSSERNFGFFNKYLLTPRGWASPHSGAIPQSILVASRTDMDNDDCNSYETTMDAITLEQALGPDLRAGFTPPFIIVP